VPAGAPREVVRRKNQLSPQAAPRLLDHASTRRVIETCAPSAASCQPASCHVRSAGVGLAKTKLSPREMQGQRPLELRARSRCRALNHSRRLHVRSVRGCRSASTAPFDPIRAHAQGRSSGWGAWPSPAKRARPRRRLSIPASAWNTHLHLQAIGGGPGGLCASGPPARLGLLHNGRGARVGPSRRSPGLPAGDRRVGRARGSELRLTADGAMNQVAEPDSAPAGPLVATKLDLGQAGSTGTLRPAHPLMIGPGPSTRTRSLCAQPRGEARCGAPIVDLGASLPRSTRRSSELQSRCFQTLKRCGRRGASSSQRSVVPIKSVARREQGWARRVAKHLGRHGVEYGRHVYGPLGCCWVCFSAGSHGASPWHRGFLLLATGWAGGIRGADTERLGRRGAQLIVIPLVTTLLFTGVELRADGPFGGLGGAKGIVSSGVTGLAAGGGNSPLGVSWRRRSFAADPFDPERGRSNASNGEHGGHDAVPLVPGDWAGGDDAQQYGSRGAAGPHQCSDHRGLT